VAGGRRTWLDGRIDVLLAALDDYGMDASRVSAAELIQERVQWVAAHLRVTPATARRYLTDETVRDLVAVAVAPGRLGVGAFGTAVLGGRPCQSSVTPSRIWSAWGNEVSAWCTRVRCAGRPSARASSMPSNKVRTGSCRPRTPAGSSSASYLSVADLVRLWPHPSLAQELFAPHDVIDDLKRR